MTIGPLQRVIAVIGLVALAPIAAMILTGSVTPEEAAVRAVIVAATVTTVGAIARQIISALIARVEDDASQPAGQTTAPATTPQRLEPNRAATGPSEPEQ